MSSTEKTPFLRSLARCYGIQTAYYDVTGRRHEAGQPALMAVLRSLGVPVHTAADVPDAWRQAQEEYWRACLEPVTVAWEGSPASITVRLPVEHADTLVKCSVILETGGVLPLTQSGYSRNLVREVSINGAGYCEKLVGLPKRLPLGYHTFTMEYAGKRETSLILSAPVKADRPDEGEQERHWGVFLPLYALHSRNSWGGGDFSDLEKLMEWTSRQGGTLLGTLPMLSTFYDGRLSASPYLPVSRLLWNEFFLDIESIPEIRECPSARELISSPAFQKEIQTLRQSPLVDYRRQMNLKRRVLEELSRYLVSHQTERLNEFHRFILDNPVVEAYARFMAAIEKQGTPWPRWPGRMRDGVVCDGDFREEDRQYHAYAQWLTFQQMARVAETSRSCNLELYLDLPVGVHPDGFDVWREREVFADGVTVGAPPDTVFTGGQDWGFPPLHPGNIREKGYQYYINYLRHHLNCAGVLRVDHVMGIHRLFCIPEGMDSGHGVYLHYPSEEMYAILALESQRYHCRIVGEDLGTVPSYVRPAMKSHGLQRMYVMQYEMAGGLEQKLNPVPSNALASLNTHDMPPFASYWQGMDIGERQQLGLLDNNAADIENKRLRMIKNGLSRILRENGLLAGSNAGYADVIKACYSLLAASRAWGVLINMEDLWQEIQPQNVPSTGEELPNWRRKAKHSFEQFDLVPGVIDTLAAINRIREQKRNRL